MADLLLIIPLGLCLWGLKFCRGVNEQALSRSGTDALRGILALGILFVHIAQYCPGGPVFALVEKLGYLLVAPFFFLTGYSLLRRHMTHPGYVKGFLRKRFFAVALPYLVITALYWSYYQLLGRRCSPWDVVVLLARGRPIVSFSWFIPAVLSFYLAFWGLMKLCKQSYGTMVLGSAVWFALYTLLCLGLQFGQWWYISAFPAVLGMFWAHREAAIKKVLQKRCWPLLITAAACLAGFLVLENLAGAASLSSLLKACAATAFTATVLLALYKLRLGNPALRLLGQLSMEIYLMQGLAIMILRSRWIYVHSPLFYGLLILVLTILLAAVVHIALKGLPNRINGGESQKIQRKKN